MTERKWEARASSSGFRGGFARLAGQAGARPDVRPAVANAHLAVAEDLLEEVLTWLRGLAFSDVQNGWLVGGFGLIYCTTDGGKTWLPSQG